MQMRTDGAGGRLLHQMGVCPSIGAEAGHRSEGLHGAASFLPGRLSSQRSPAARLRDIWKKDEDPDAAVVHITDARLLALLLEVGRKKSQEPEQTTGPSIEMPMGR